MPKSITSVNRERKRSDCLVKASEDVKAESDKFEKNDSVALKLKGRGGAR
ncbi:MAG: hypothetical protein IKL83_01185 [Muribaculaceae bacterium]|nr:hypothetical protein [Muribaculaceae bacterium]